MKGFLSIAICQLLLIQLCSGQVTLQKTARGSIKGLVIDSATGKTLPDVSVLILSKDSSITSTSTNASGVFHVVDLPRERFELEVSHSGYKTQQFQITLERLPDIHIGTVALVPSINELQEVKLVAKKPLIEYEIDKLTYNVDSDPESKVLTAFDMMRKVPQLSIDAEDNLQINGNSSFLVLINGKRSSLFTRDPGDILKSMPASTIKTIEVISSPSSKYEAEGLAGIINIITYKKIIGGYSGSAGMTVSSPNGFSTNASSTLKAGRLGLSVYYGNSSSFSPTASNNFYRNNIQMQNIFEQFGTLRSNSRLFYAGGEVSYELDSLNLVSFNYSRNKSSGTNYFGQDVELLDYRGNVLNAYHLQNIGINSMVGDDLGVDYQKTFKGNSEKIITLSYKLATSSNDYFSYLNRDLFLIPWKETSTTDNRGANTEHTFQIDFVDGSAKFTPEVGVKAIMRINGSDYEYRFLSPASGLMTLDPQSNKFDFNQNVYAGYSSFSLRKENWSFKAGARLEAAITKADFLTSGTQVSVTYFNLFPTIMISRKIKDASTLRVNYTQRVERPGLYYLDPFIDLSDPKNLSYGNPGLKPALNNLFTISYNTFKNRTSFSFNAMYNFTNNNIERFTFLGSDTITRTTYGNIGKHQTFGISFNLNTSVLNQMNININGSANYIRNKTDLVSDNNGFAYNVLSYLSYRFANGIRSSVNFGYNSGNILLQGRSSGYFWNTVVLNKDILKSKKGTVSLSINNPVNKVRKIETKLQDVSFYQVQQSHSNIRKFSLSFSYRFGGLQEDIIRKKRGIKNDDVKTADKSNTIN